MNTNIKWNVFYEDFNKRTIASYNIFNHYYFHKDCKKIAMKYKDNKEMFAEKVELALMCYFWSKCEWEIIVESLFSKRKDVIRKIDVYEQVMNNWDVFIDYLWNNKELL